MKPFLAGVAVTAGCLLTLGCSKTVQVPSDSSVSCSVVVPNR